MKSKFIVVMLAFMALVVFQSCENVGPNRQGVLMENYGKNGKSDFSLQKGKVWTAAPGSELFIVPLQEQREDFGDRVLNLKSADNTAFLSRPMYSYTVIEDRAVDVVFNNNHLGNSDEFLSSLAENVLEPMIYDLTKEESRKYKTDQLMADGGSLEFENNLEEVITKAFEKKGLKLESFSAQLEFTQAVTEKIDKRNEVNTDISVLDQEIAKQKKKNELEALIAEQNIIKSKGLTPQIIQMEFIQAWRETKQPLYGNIPVTIMKQ